MPKNINFFAYGPIADPAVINAITARKVIGYAATLSGYELAVQKIDDITNKKVDSRSRSPREALYEYWNRDFEMYVLVKGKGKVNGIVWKITREDLAAIRYWELVHLGWQKFVAGKAKTDKGRSISVTTMAVTRQHINRKVDGTSYDNFLGKGKKFRTRFISAATGDRKAYLAWKAGKRPGTHYKYVGD